MIREYIKYAKEHPYEIIADLCELMAMVALFYLLDWGYSYYS